MQVDDPGEVEVPSLPAMPSIRVLIDQINQLAVLATEQSGAKCLCLNNHDHQRPACQGTSLNGGPLGEWF
jgi:hypothetical protein